MLEWQNHLHALRWACKTFQPKHILEWGCGHSTVAMHEVVPDAQILSIDHITDWAEKWKDRLPSENVKIVHQNLPAKLNPGEHDGYATYPLRHGYRKSPIGTTRNRVTFDMAFVDGRLRADCITVAKECVHMNGIVIVHDASRRAYQDAILAFPHTWYHPTSTIALLSCMPCRFPDAPWLRKGFI